MRNQRNSAEENIQIRRSTFGRTYSALSSANQPSPIHLDRHHCNHLSGSLKNRDLLRRGRENCTASFFSVAVSSLLQALHPYFHSIFLYFYYYCCCCSFETMNSPTRRVSISEPPGREITPLLPRPQSSDTIDSSEYGTELFERIKDDAVTSNSDTAARESILADNLSMRLLQVDDDDDETEMRILRESLNISLYGGSNRQGIDDVGKRSTRKAACERLFTMVGMSLVVFSLIFAALYVGVEFIGPPNQPVGPYQLVERQVSGRNRVFLWCRLCLFV